MNGTDEGFVRAVERSIEARIDTACLSSMVRFLDIRKTAVSHSWFLIIFTFENCNLFIKDAQPLPTLWIGTNGGELFVYTIGPAATESITTTTAISGVATTTTTSSTAAPPSDTFQLAKHLTLRHSAPILACFLVDARGFDVDHKPPVAQQQGCVSPDSGGSHHQRLLVVSEEQLKVCGTKC